MEDPRNLGACIRSAAGFGLQAFCYPGKGSCGLTPSVAKASSGASELLPICRLGDASVELSELKSAGFKVIGLESKTHNPPHKLSLQGPMVLVVGGEDRGIPPHIRRHCDNLVNIPIAESAHSYNASVAFSLLLYEINRQTNFGKKLICGMNS
jgi:23S rRNA (guanosine2251-2'-O)-methyltransferase